LVAETTLSVERHVTRDEQTDDRENATPVRFVRGDEYIEVSFSFAPEGKFTTAHCEALGTSAFGVDQEEAMAAIVEAVILQLEALEDAGELERFFEENGVKVTREPRPHWNAVNPRFVPA
jgi:hypothetical protein